MSMEALAAPERCAFAAYARHVNPTLAEFLGVTGRHTRFVQATGNTLRSHDGRLFKDWIAGFGSLNLGHNPPGPLAALQAFAQSNAPNLFVESLNPAAGLLAQFLVQQAGAHFETCFFSNSGSEAVEAALKLAVAATRRHTFVYCTGAYHGTTLGALSMMGHGMYRQPFESILPRWCEIPFNDEQALAAALATEDVAAVVIEPVQVESGMRGVTPAFLSAARTLCDQTSTLLVLDEVQTGMGRTGHLFAFQSVGITPDILCLAKGLGCGLVPIGATVYERGLFKRAYGTYEKCEAHNSTYGGNALACRVALAGARELADSSFLQAVRQRAAFLSQEARRRLANHPLVRRIEFHGLLGAIELEQSVHPWFDWSAFGMGDWSGRPSTGPLLVHRLYKRGFLLQVCGHDWRCIRLEPPLTVSELDCHELMIAISEEIDWIHSHD